MFEINSKGEVTLPKGEIFIRGTLRRIYLESKTYSFRITDGTEDLISKSWVTSEDVEFKGSSSFEFEERIFLFEEKTIRIEEIFYYQRAGYSIGNENGTLISRIDFFKL